MDIQWYPGHMAKAKKMMEENLKLVDVVIEILDARIPRSSQNPDLQHLARHKKRIIVLNKADLADKQATQAWIHHFKRDEIYAVATDANRKKGTNAIFSLASLAMKEKIESQISRGRKFVPIRAMVVGIPNVGKSTLINQIAGKKVAKAADKPGVTRGKQWVRLKRDFELLDTPGLLWPKQKDKEVSRHLAYTGSFNDEIIGREVVARNLATFLYENYKDLFLGRYPIDETEEDLIIAIGKCRGFLRKGGEIDEERTAVIFLDEFRGGLLGPISLEFA